MTAIETEPPDRGTETQVPSVRSGIPAKSLALRVINVAPAIDAVTPIEMSAARLRGEPNDLKTSAAAAAIDSEKGMIPSAPKKERAVASCSGVRGPRENSYQATALNPISLPDSAVSLPRICCRISSVV
jgi:hypothetical protein